MYMAPLNYDRFFKKVFSDDSIAKTFLEDIFDIEIQEIESLKERHKITDDARVVEFDYRCKIDNQYVIIDMQQWSKPDIAHRFYIYHAVNSALQLETLPSKKLLIDETTNKIIKVKDYRRVEPVITLVWLVHDDFENEKDFLSFIMTPEDIVDFVRNEGLWNKKDTYELFQQRESLLKILNNKEKNIDFISKNKLMFAFQKNIANNPKHKKYFNWFKFAELSSNKNNKAKDFDELKKDKHFKDIYLKCKKRLATKELTKTEKKYLTNEEDHQAQIQRYIDGIKAEKLNDLNCKHENVINSKNKIIKNNQKELENKDKLIAELTAKLNQKGGQ